MSIDWGKVPADIQNDIFEYILDNNYPETPWDLDSKTAFHYWLQWNGLLGYTESILQAGETLGLFEVRK